MTGPKMNPPRGYKRIKPLCAHDGERLPAPSERCPDPGTPCICCRVPCTAYREPVPEWATGEGVTLATAAYVAALERS
jgi:hypothetical protein